MLVNLFSTPLAVRRSRESPSLARPLTAVGAPASEVGAMPVPAGYLSDSPAAAFASSASLIPPPPINTRQPGVVTSLLYSGSKFRGHQKSKGNSYDVEVVLQVRLIRRYFIIGSRCQRHLVMCQSGGVLSDS